MQSEGRLTVARAALLDAAVDVARRLRAFDEYGSEARATRALRRRCPGFGDGEYASSLSAALQLFDAAHTVATQRAPEFQSIRRPTESDWEPDARRLAERYPGFPEATYRWVTGWTIYYFALR